jgi:ATP-binding cassette subfamily B protein
MSVADDEDPDLGLRERADQVDYPLIRLFREYGWDSIHWFAFGVLTSTLARFLAIVPPVILGLAIDAVFRTTKPYELPLVPSAWIPSGRGAQFELSVAIMAVALVLSSACNFARQSSLNLFSHRVKHEVRTATYQQMQRLDMDFFNDKQTGELMSILNNDTNRLELFLDNMMSSAIQLGVLVLGIGGVLLWLNPQLAVVTLFIIPIAALFTRWFMKTVEAQYSRIRASVGDLNSRLENNLAGIEVIKTAGTEDYEDDRVRRASYEYFRQDWRALRMNFIYRPGMQLLTSVSFVATFIIGGIWVTTGPPEPFTGTLEVGELVTFLLLTQRLVDPLTQMSQIVDRYEDAKASTTRILGLMEVPVGVTDREDAIVLDEVDGHVKYEDVHFRYEEETVLHGIDVEAAAGDTVGFVGPTGAGKSTILKLLVRLYDVDQGAIRVDGHDIRDIQLASLRDHVGYVSQDTFLFDGTIAENIRYGSFDASDEAVRDAARKAEAHEFITELPNGYNTEVGERGVKLSGGQRQRITIARTVLKDPEILVLDEATSDVDTETEMLIQRSLDRLSQDRTTFVIAHRLSTVRDADQLLVVEDGKIVERGTHTELLERDGLYANLWHVQAGEIEDLPDEFVQEAQRRAAERGDD